MGNSESCEMECELKFHPPRQPSLGSNIKQEISDVLNLDLNDKYNVGV